MNINISEFVESGCNKTKEFFGAVVNKGRLYAKNQPRKFAAMLAVAVLLIIGVVVLSCTPKDNKNPIPKHNIFTEETILSGSDGKAVENPQGLYEDDGNIMMSVKALPCPITYNGKKFYLSTVDCYQSYIDYTYTFVFVVSFDTSALDDRELHWITENDLVVHTLIDSKENSEDIINTRCLGVMQDGNYLRFVYIPDIYNEYRYSFEGSEIAISIAVQQEEKYEYEDPDNPGLTKTGKYKYKYGYGKSVPFNMNKVNTMPKPILDNMSEWVKELA